MKQCPNCKLFYPDDTTQCPNCGNSLSGEGNATTLYISRPHLPKGSTVTQILALIVVALGAFAGYYYGNAYAIQTTFYQYAENSYKFNTALAVTIWLTTAVSVIMIYLSYCHFKNQENTNCQLDSIYKLLNQIEKNTRNK